MQNNVLNGKIGLSLYKMAVPLFFLNLLNSLYGVVDTYFVGKIGQLAVGAVSLVQPIMWCALSVAMGLSAGATAIISSYYGANDHKNASRFTTQILYFCFFFALVLSVGTYVLRKPILAYLKTPDEIYMDAFHYLEIMAFDYFGLFMIDSFMAIRQACGDSKTGVIYSSVASIINVILDPIFIFVFHMGVAGAAMATVLSKLIVVPVLLWLLMKKNDVYVSFKEFKFNVKDATHILKLSAPSASGQFLEALGFVIMNKYIVSYGAIAISAYGIGEKLTNLYNIPIISFANILPTFIGQNLGANQIERAKSSLRVTNLIALSLSLVLLIVGILIMKPSILLFIPLADEELISVTSTFVFFSLLMGPFVAWYFNLCAVFNGSGHTNISFMLSLVRLWGTRIPIIYIFMCFTSFGLNGIWYAMLISNCIVCIMAWLLYKKYPWYYSKAMLANKDTK